MVSGLVYSILPFFKAMNCSIFVQINPDSYRDKTNNRSTYNERISQ